ncbi:MAG: tRNA 2-thiouridine synthesizing protein [Chloroflexota bacterium]|jgi:TusA-related sulfurtransferase|nr:tRNA 2-thiouridine synthesizing protein [Chloroflexota bacterium]
MTDSTSPDPARTVDARGLRCPLPLLRARNEIDLLASGEVLEVLATVPGADHDLRAWTRRARHEFLSVDEQPGPVFRFLLRKA